ncbi:MAG: sulfur oxidation c-type cytochrome SoxX [Gammaproteobacteria bacterium]|nr:sulfur oxidation c-type cytochrome SoxX [Gammaproteobacteria bacterium]
MKYAKVTATAAAGALLFVSTGAQANGEKPDYTAMTPEALAEYLIFEANGIKLDQKTQEGATVKERQMRDELQTICSGGTRATLAGDDLAKVASLGRAGIVKPEGGVKLGDWKKGQELARSGFGFRVGHNNDDHSTREPGGNCYACHQLDPKEIAYGTLGPSLMNYGKLRGNSQAIIDYTYDVVYSPHSFFPCTHMPRFGANGVLTQQQIADVLAYLIDPASPVNQ